MDEDGNVHPTLFRVMNTGWCLFLKVGTNNNVEEFNLKKTCCSLCSHAFICGSTAIQTDSSYS